MTESDSGSLDDLDEPVTPSGLGRANEGDGANASMEGGAAAAEAEARAEAETKAKTITTRIGVMLRYDINLFKKPAQMRRETEQYFEEKEVEDLPAIYP